jgi:hypothetical protein
VRTPRELADAVSAVVMDGERRGPCRPDEVVTAEQRLGITLPADVRAFYGCMNGTADMTDVEHGLITLWPLDKWNRIEDEAPADARGPLANTVVFADHSYWCWAYSARFSSEPSDQMEVFLVGVGAPSPIAKSFTEFVQMVLSGDEALYGKAG